MIDIGVAGGSAGTDLVAMSKGSRSSRQSDGDGKGFLDALTSSRDTGRKSDTTARNGGDTATTDTDSDAKTDTETVTGTQTGTDTDTDTAGLTTSDGKTTLPANGNATSASTGTGTGADMIDPSLANIANPTEQPKGAKQQPGGAKFPNGAGTAHLAKSLLGFQKPVAADPTVTGKVPPTDPKTAGDADAAKPQDPLEDIAQQLADVISGDQPVQTDSSGKTNTPAVKTGKTVTTDDGKSQTTQAAPAAATVSDALSLLNVPQAAGLIAAAPQSVATVFAGAAGKAQADPDQPLPKVADAMMLPNASTDTSNDSTTLPATTDANAASQTFRLVRADGRGGALDMSISKGSDDTTQVDVTASSGGSADTVTVLDSRRFLGLAANNNSALVTGAIAGDREWSGAMQPGSALSNAASWTSTGKVVNTLKIQLHPDDLGEVTATMRLQGDQLSVDIKVQTGEAYRQLHADQDHMIDSLRAQGYQVDRITVSMAANADQQSDSGRQPGSQSQSQQQSLMNQGQGGDARPRGQNYSGQQANGKDVNLGKGERGMEDSAAAAAAAQRQRSGDVYL